MILGHCTWKDVEALSRDAVVLIPTGALEQHGPHLPLLTDTILATAVAEGVERRLPTQTLLTPPVWLGASAHHLLYAGTLSATFEGYGSTMSAIVESLLPHGFRKFFIINGHGGNDEPNGIVLRGLKAKYPNAMFGHAAYYSLIAAEIAAIAEGPLKEIHHADEFEASLMLHVAPNLVRKDHLRDDGLVPDPRIAGMVHSFDELSEEGSIGYASLATADKGERLLQAAIEAMTDNIRILAEGYVLSGLKST
jgi:creatinine amidohydrolase